MNKHLTDAKTMFSTKQLEYEKEAALLKQRYEFTNKEYDNTKAKLKNVENSLNERINEVKEEKERIMREAIGKLTDEKNSINDKYQKLMIDSKEKEERLFKGLN